MVTYRVDEDFKFCVLEPGRLALSSLARIRTELRDMGLWGGGVRLDIEMTLRLVRLLLRHSEYEQGGVVFGKRRPRDIIRGVRVTYFKGFGKASAIMNDSLYPLPSWFAVESKADYDAYCAIINEPYGDKGEITSGPLSGLKEDHSDDVSLLQDYRRWLLSGDLADLLEFHSRFAAVLMPRKAGGKYFREFDSRILTILLTKGYGMVDNVSEIVTATGFLNIARAIRNTTIYAVGMKNSNREPRFGLAQRFKQRIKAGKSEFLQELSEFVQNQNWEVQHKLKGAGFVVSTTDLDEVVKLVDARDNGHQLVGMLLLAYGFARAESTATTTAEEPAAN